ncbi:MAG: twin-arginine translocase TatA/TatE family subunit [Firmicutes bacterium]|nr:twin-arginine translocase TatA/TatE family subunit [Bacillota bacterium]
MPSVGPWEIIAILAIVLIIFGPGKLPEVGKSLGKTIREFRKATTEVKDNQEEVIKEPQTSPNPNK